MTTGAVELTYKFAAGFEIGLGIFSLRLGRIIAQRRQVGGNVGRVILGGVAMQELRHTSPGTLRFGVENPFGQPTTMRAAAHGVEVRAAHGKFRQAGAFAGVAPNAAMFQKHFAAALDQPSLSERRSGQMRELPAPDWFVRHGFIRALAPKQAELRIALHRASVVDLDRVGTFVQTNGLRLGLRYAANAFEIQQHGVVDLQLHAAFAGSMEGIIPA